VCAGKEATPTTVRRNKPPIARDTALPVASRRDRAVLQTVNFFMADVRAGIGPFLWVLLQSRGWATGAIGTVTAMGGIAGLIATAPAGALINATTRKRACVVVASVFTVVASGLALVSGRFWVVASSLALVSVRADGAQPAEHDVAAGLHQPLTDDHPLCGVGVGAGLQVGLEHRWLCLFDLQDKRVVAVSAQRQHHPRPQTDAAYSNHLACHARVAESASQQLDTHIQGFA
jgi:hypothetical protein